MKATQRLYRTADGEVVAEGDIRAAFLLVTPGHDVPKEYQAKVREFLGDQEAPDDDAAEVDEKAQEAPDDDKQATPAQNKAKGRSGDK